MFLAILLLASCDNGFNNSGIQQRFPIYTSVKGITVKIVDEAEIRTKSANASYYTITSPDYPQVEPLIVEILEIANGLLFVNHYCADGELIAEFKYVQSQLIEMCTAPDFAVIDTKANGLRERGEGYLSCVKRVYHDKKEEVVENNEILCDFASPLCEAAALYVAVIGCGYYEDQPVI